MAMKKGLLILVFLVILCVANESHAVWYDTFNISGFGDFNGLYGSIVSGSNNFYWEIDGEHGSINDYFPFNSTLGQGWGVGGQPDTGPPYTTFEATSGIFWTVGTLEIGFTDPNNVPFAWDLEVYWEPSAINPEVSGYENFDLNQISEHLTTVHYEYNGSEWSFTTSYPTDPVPEPATMLLLGSGLVSLAGFKRKFRKR